MFRWLRKLFGISVRHGSTRTVWLYKQWAFKFPRCESLETFFKGLAANHKERLMSRHSPSFFVPVLHSIPGFLVVMPRVKPFDGDCPLVRCFMIDLFHESRDENPEAQTARYYCEWISGNYGMYKGKPMCIDYGTFVPLEATRFAIRREMDMFEWSLKRRLSVGDEVEEDIRLEEEPYQICLELLDIPVFTADVEDKGCPLAHELDDQQPNPERQVSGTNGSHCGKSDHGLGADYSGSCSIPLQGYPIPNEADKTTVVLH